MNCLKDLFFIFISFKISLPLPNNSNRSEIIFDQRQTGKYNIHLSIKDVAIIEIGNSNDKEDSSADMDDYYYDDTDLTVKPWFPTSAKPNQTSTSQITPTIAYLNSSETSTRTSPIYVTPVRNETDPGQDLTSEIYSSTENLVSVDSNTEQMPPSSVINLLPLNSSISSNTSNSENAVLSSQVTIENNTQTLSSPTNKPQFLNKENTFKVIMEPVLIPRLRSTANKLRYSKKEESRLYRLNTARRMEGYKCRIGQLLDKDGNCRPKRTPITNLIEQLFTFFRETAFNKRLESKQDLINE